MELNELIPAAIGLLGVLIGGGLQIWSQLRRDRDKEIFEVRQNVSDFIIDAMNVASYVQIIAKQSNEPGHNETKVRELLSELEEKNQDLVHKAVELLAWGESKLSEQARRVSGLCRDAVTKVRQAVLVEAPLSSLEGKGLKLVISREANVLGQMVAPRRWERRLRFRRSNRSRKLLDRPSTK